jgi:hypothetical protein
VNADLDRNETEYDTLRSGRYSREQRRVKDRCGTYNERDDSVHCGVLPISSADEGYERSKDTESVQCATLDDNKYNSPIQPRIQVYSALRFPGKVYPRRDSSYYVGEKHGA